MKKKMCFLVFSIFFLGSCSTSNCIKTYLKDERGKRKENNIIPVLTDKKIDVFNTLNVYMGRTRGDWSTQAKAFTQKDYDFMNNKYKYDTIPSKWTKKESNDFEFASLVKKGELSKFRDSISSRNQNLEVYNYNLSSVIFNENKDLAFFSLIVTKQPSTTVDNCVIIMKKENAKWVFLEKVHSTALR